ncbi:long-chain fatty acid--CoA ligase [Actinobacteria bacterium YIM 96077]|uniref:Long-chain fatty acid--CoA ligase n=1 Tax=Phytoactinopolyspora halophila TaxID=1981511 RepID=A0A329QET7_9ACTN|nr:long-chain fatty acid--CoA ligase [Phytoactinopolyspora halophila]AYY14086.1 long-chain fatty acid--CoA ligase [Actinobacteria bacterium YIM 96077]RAW10993.1 long-chain fatty acid--CoA ligase [Phytoactinopolyspora halophila]
MTADTAETIDQVTDRPPSIGRMFLERVEATPDLEAYRYPDGVGWSSLTWRQTKDRVWRLAAGLLSVGVEFEQRVAIAASTRVEWILADLAINCIGAATTTVYPSTNPEDVEHILSDSNARVVFAEDDEQVKKVLEQRSQLPDLVKIVVMDGTGDGDVVISLDELEQRGGERLEQEPTAVDDALEAVGPETLATLVYTSGTGGRPKGVLLVNDNWVYEGVAVDAVNILSTDDLQYLWLPLSHVFGKTLEAIQLRVGFATAVDGNLDRIVENLGVVKPTFMAGAPRIFEKVRARVTTTAAEEGGLKKKIFDWAFGVGHKVSALRQEGKEPSGVLAVQFRLADKLVFSKVKARLGGRIRFFISGSAKLSQEVAEWFHAADMLILEGYGLTETSAAVFVNRLHDNRFGTVGPPLPGTEVKIADDGEILVRSPAVMRGYHNMPELTAESIDEDGWYHTGDIGALENGFLRVTDRKKDLIKTSGGKYIAPQKIEVIFKAVSPQASQIVVHGDGRNYCTALITLDPEAIREWAESNGLGDMGYAELTQTPQVRELVQGQIDELNSRLGRWETIKNFEILPHDLTIESGDLTPSLKVKRKAVEKRYMDVLDRMYD